MKKLFVLLVVIVGAYFGLKKWSPRTLERIAFWKTASDTAGGTSLPSPLPAPKPDAAPQPQPPPNPDRVAVTAVDPARPTTPVTDAPPPPVAKQDVDKSAQVVVLCYHRLEGPAAGIYSITPELFEQHMQRLKDGGISVISMRDFLAWRRSEKSIPARSALITIDDGYVSALEVARPILKRFGYPWTYFVYTNYIARGGKSVSWEQLAELRDEGVDIGSHTVSHLDLREVRGKSPEAYDAWLREEIIGSKKTIEEKLGIRCEVFAYPFGAWNGRIVDLVREAGYSGAFTVAGQRLTHAAPAERLGRYAWDNKRPLDIELAFRFQGALAAPASESVVPGGQPSAALLTQPLDGETISDAQPALKANLATLGKIEPASVSIRLSGVGLIPCKYDPESKNVEARPPGPLKTGDHTVHVSAKVGGKRVERQWTFHVDPTGGTTKTLEQISPP
jgi:peptidoglycan/xylan/chitin deacetylase (PgdA/CDA1 family)